MLTLAPGCVYTEPMTTTRTRRPAKPINDVRRVLNVAGIGQDHGVRLVTYAEDGYAVEVSAADADPMHPEWGHADDVEVALRAAGLTFDVTHSVGMASFAVHARSI